MVAKEMKRGKDGGEAEQGDRGGRKSWPIT
jgi:hypothetical protein